VGNTRNTVKYPRAVAASFSGSSFLQLTMNEWQFLYFCDGRNDDTHWQIFWPKTVNLVLCHML